MRNKNGITLIALIITIIVMLILVAVTINVSTNGNLFNYAKESTQKTNLAKAREQVDMVKISWKIAETADTNATISTFVEEQKNLGNIDEYIDLGDGQYKIIKDGYEDTIESDVYITFYIYHSSDNTVETIEHRRNVPYNIYAKTKENSLYGGYYTNYAGKGSYAGDGVEIKDGTEKKYNGSNVTWNTDEAITENGKAMNPIDGTTYYLREVPAKYLCQYIHYTKTGTNIEDIWVMSAIDDLNYQEVGYLINTKDNACPCDNITRSLTITAGSNSETLTSVRVFNARGYLSYKKMTSYKQINGELKTWAYWVTADNILVTGKDIWEWNFGNLTTDTFTATKVDE